MSPATRKALETYIALCQFAVDAYQAAHFAGRAKTVSFVEGRKRFVKIQVTTLDSGFVSCLGFMDTVSGDLFKGVHGEPTSTAVGNVFKPPFEGDRLPYSV